MTFIKYVHLLALVAWLGGMIFFSFIAAPAVFKELSREMAGAVVGNIFPKYWILGYICAALLLGTLIYIARGDYAAYRTPIIILAVTAILAAVAGQVVGSKARDIKAQMYAEQDAVKKEALRKAFGKTHAVSSVINLAIVILLLVYAWHLPRVIAPTAAEALKETLRL